MNEYELLGGLHKIINDDIDVKINEWFDSHNVNYYLLYPLAAIELGAIKETPENIDNLLKRCVAAFVYKKAVEFKKQFHIKKFNEQGFKKYIKAYKNELLPLYQNFRFSREINDINPFSKPRLIADGDHRYKLTTSLVSDKYKEEYFYFYGVDDKEKSNNELDQVLFLHMKFWDEVILGEKGFDDLYQYPKKKNREIRLCFL